MSFSKYKSVRKLQELKGSPVDLTAKGAVTPDRLKKMRREALGFQFFFGTERITENVLHTLFHLAEEAKVHEQMKEMQAGKIINKIAGCES